MSSPSDFTGVVEFDFLTLVLHDPIRNVMRLHILESRIFTDKVAGKEMPIEGHPAGWVWQSQQPFVVNEEDTRYPLFLQQLREAGVHSIAMVPLTTAQRRVGALGFGTLLPQKITDSELAFMQRVASQVAVAVDNALNLETSQAPIKRSSGEERDSLRVLLEVNNVLVSTRELPGNFSWHCFDSRACDRIIADYTSLALLDPFTGVMKIYALDFPGRQELIKPEVTVLRDYVSVRREAIASRKVGHVRARPGTGALSQRSHDPAAPGWH